MTSSPTTVPHAPHASAAMLRDLVGQRVVVIGAGRTGLAVAGLAHARGAVVCVCDDAEPTARTARLESAGLSAEQVTHAALTAEALADADHIVLSPGVPRAHPAVQAAVARGQTVSGEFDFAMAVHWPAYTAAITGTNGKSTTTTMLGSIADAIVKNAEGAFGGGAFVGGNLGRPYAEALLEGERPAIGVFELSSYQLESMHHADFDVGIVTNLAPDHLDRYESVELYYAAKMHLASRVKPEGVWVINADDAQLVAKSRDVARRTWTFGADAPEDAAIALAPGVLHVRTPVSTSIALDNPRMLGLHNAANAAAAALAGWVLGGTVMDVEQGLARWPGIAHRLQVLGAAHGVQWVNDSKATNVAAAEVAVRSFDRGVHLLAGGVGKGASYAPLVAALAARGGRMYVFGEDAPALLAACGDDVECTTFTTMDAAAAAAQKTAAPGDVVLLAPACASFDQFKNYAVRGDAFAALFERAAVPREDSARGAP